MYRAISNVEVKRPVGKYIFDNSDFAIEHHLMWRDRNKGRLNTNLLFVEFSIPFMVVSHVISVLGTHEFITASNS